MTSIGPAEVICDPPSSRCDETVPGQFVNRAAAATFPMKVRKAALRSAVNWTSLYPWDAAGGSACQLE